VSTAEFEIALAQQSIIDNATQHTVLTPPPPDATWLGSKFHTMKEIAVRCYTFIVNNLMDSNRGDRLFYDENRNSIGEVSR
jgi:hypothetical protein